MVGATHVNGGGLVYYLGTGTSFDVSNIPGYQNLTADNFIVGISYVGNTGSKLPCRDDISGGIQGTTVGKTYDAITGTLKITGNNIRFAGYEVGTQTATTTFFAYLVKGKIKDA